MAAAPLRLLVADELGYVRSLGAAGPAPEQLAATRVVSRWGDGLRARGAERFALSDGEEWGGDAQLLAAGACARGGWLSPCEC